MGNSFFLFLRRAFIFAMLAGVMTLGLALPSQAEEVACEVTHDLVADLVHREARKGLSIGLQEQINHLVLQLETCPEPVAHSFEAFPASVRHWAPLVSVYFEPDDVARVLCLMELESGGDKSARNPTSGASGLMQVMPFWAGHLGYQVSDLFQPAQNLEIAAYILDQQGWQAWSPFVRGSCR